MSTDNSYDHSEESYGRDTFSRIKREGSEQRSKPIQGRRRGKGPQSVNGIHKRRRRKMSW